MAERVIEVRGLRKSYRDVEAVRGVDLHVDRGEVFALLGPNGAGKTTITEILEGYREPTSGEAIVLGHDPAMHERALRRRVGIVLQWAGTDQYLTVRETVEMFAGYYPAPRPVDEVLDVVGLSEKTGARVDKLSGGQKRRLDVAIALVGDAELLFLDEPTTGFDPNARRSAWELVRNLTTLGKTIWLTTHFMDEAQYLANRVAVISRGEIVAEGPPSTLAGRDRMRARIRFRVADPAGLPHLGQAMGDDGSLEISVADPTEVLHRLTGWALDRGVPLEGLEVLRPSLEDVYLEITGDERAERRAEAPPG